MRSGWDGELDTLLLWLDDIWASSNEGEGEGLSRIRSYRQKQMQTSISVTWNSVWRKISITVFSAFNVSVFFNSLLQHKNNHQCTKKLEAESNKMHRKKKSVCSTHSNSAVGNKLMFQDNFCLPQSPAVSKHQSACTVLKLLNLTVCSRNVLLSVIISPGSETHWSSVFVSWSADHPSSYYFFFYFNKKCCLYMCFCSLWGHTISVLLNFFYQN